VGSSRQPGRVVQHTGGRVVGGVVVCGGGNGMGNGTELHEPTIGRMAARLAMCNVHGRHMGYGKGSMLAEGTAWAGKQRQQNRGALARIQKKPGMVKKGTVTSSNKPRTASPCTLEPRQRGTIRMKV